MQHLERALDRQNQWWKYPVVFILGFFVAGLIGAIPMVAVIAYYTNGDIRPGALSDPTQYGVPPNLSLLLMLLPFLIGMVIVRGSFMRLHKRSLQETINGTGTIRWKRFFRGAAVWGSLSLICFLVDYAIHPGNFKFNFQASSFIPLVLVSVLLIPVQASFEEVMFRGYLAQGLAPWTKSRWVVLAIPSLLFGLVHSANPEIREYGFWLTMPSYILIGFVLGLVSILDDGIEIAMGAHTVNNILGSTLITFKSSAFATPALFYQLHVDPVRDLVILVVVSVVFVAVLGRKYQWNYAVLNRKVQRESVSIPAENDVRNLGPALDAPSVTGEEKSPFPSPKNLDHNAYTE